MAKRLSSGFRQRMCELRTQMLVFFTIGMAVVLAFAVLLTYNTTSETIGRINRRNTMSELALVSASLERVSGDALRQSDGIIRSDYFRVLQERDKHSELDIVYAIRQFHEEARLILINFPVLHSVYLILDDGYVLCATENNMQRFAEVDIEKYPVFADSLAAVSGRDIHYVGGFMNKDLPFFFGVTNVNYHKLLAMVRQVGECTVWINMHAEDIAALYAKNPSAQTGVVRILNREGEIVSSAYPEENGSRYPYVERIAEADEGIYALDERDTQLVWLESQETGLTILSEVELRVYWQDLNRITYRMLLVIVVGYLLTCLFLWGVLGRAFRPVEKLRASMARAGAGDYGGILPTPGQGELGLLTQSYNDMLRNIRELTERTAQAESEKRLTELKALRNQINPHFLFNTLNTIRWMCVVGGNKDAAECISTLGGIISPMFRSDVPYCTMEEEAQSVRLFVRIMNARLGGGIVLREDIPEETRGTRVLRLILQPIAENAITHGFEGGRGEIWLKVRQKDAPDGMGNMLEIVMRNNGKPLEEKELAELNQTLRSGGEAKGIGLINTARRLYLQYGPGSAHKCSWAGICMQNAPEGGVMAVITLPVSDENDENMAKN